MQTKEQILTNCGEAWEYSNRLLVCPVVDAKIAMDEFAKEIAIGFYNWVVENYWPMADNELMATGSDRRYKAEELYDIYLKTFNK